MLPNNFKKIFSIFLLLVVLSFSFSSVFINKAYAIPTEEIGPSLYTQIWTKVETGLKWVWDKVGAVLYKNTLTYFLTQLAQETATWIASSGPGQRPLFEQRPIGTILEDAAGGALGDFIDTLVKDGVGFENFDICNPPNIKTQFDISYTLFNEYGKSAKKPKCTWRNITKNWDAYIEKIKDDPKKYLADLSFSFDPRENDYGAYLKAESALLSKQQNDKYNAAIKRLTEKSGLKPITSQVSGAILAPEATVENFLLGGTKDANAPLLNYTGEAVADAVGVFTNTLASKLMQRWMKKGLAPDLPAQSSPSFAWNNGSEAVAKSRQDFINEPLTVSQVDLSKSGSSLRLADSLSLPKIPCQGCVDKKAGPTYEVLSQDFMAAVEQRLTLAEAIKNGVINGGKIFGYTKEQDKIVEPDWQSGLSYRSIVIGRTMRVFPYSWEVAAGFIKNYGKLLQFSNSSLTLAEVMNCYEEKDDPFGKTIYGTLKKDDPRFPEKCRADFNGNGSYADLNPMVDYNPFYHLVDPNWVLKIPETYCKRMGAGSEKTNVLYMCLQDNMKNTLKYNGALEATPAGEGVPMCDYNSKGNDPADLKVAVVTRDENYCADWQSCVVENADGSCQTKGYCLAEKPVTKLAGTSCDYPSRGNGVYNSCESFSTESGQVASYLRNTLQSCDTNDAGCSLYGLTQVPDSTGNNVWSLDKQVFLNSKAVDCDSANAGCTKVTPYNSGVNLAFNGSFTDKDFGNTSTPTPKNWTLEARSASCEIEADNNFSFVLTRTGSGVAACVVDSAGFIPVERGYRYALKASFNELKKIASISNLRIDLDLLAYDANKNRIAGNYAGTSINGYFAETKFAKTENIIIDGNVLPTNTKYVKVEIALVANDGAVGSGKARLSVSDAQLVVTQSPVISQNGKFDNLDYYHSDYGSSKESFHMKLAPDYLNCQDYYKINYNYSNPSTCNTAGKVWNSGIGYCVEGGSSECASYAALCSSADLGCQGYTPLAGGSEISAKLATSDQCPVSCLNYDSYYQEPNNFEIRDYPRVYKDPSTCQANNGTWDGSKCLAMGAYTSFIPKTAQDCSAPEVGCQEFTNLDAVKQGGEAKEYFTFLRQCVAAENPEINTYYTWEGSDTTGYQLKKWLRLQSNLKDGGRVGPCTNFDSDTNKCLDSGSGWSNPLASIGNRGVCLPGDLLTNPDCRDFFDINDNHYYILQSRTVSAPAKDAPGVCHPYRSTKTGQIYNADPTDAVSCQPKSVGCQAYRGNNGNNVKNILQSNFEQGSTSGWTNSAGDPIGLTISNEALQQNGHSLRVYIHDDKIKATLPAGSLISGKYYNLNLIAKKGVGSGNKPGGGISLINGWFKQVAGYFSPDIAQAQNQGMDFVLPSLVKEWQKYQIGPIQYNGGLSGEISFTLQVNGLGANEQFFVDNIVLQAFENNFYKIEKSWSTPVECDNLLDNPNGCDQAGQNCGQRLANGAQLGCMAYSDRSQTQVNLKSFDSLCPATSIGCSAFINTQNTSDTLADKTYQAECNEKNGNLVLNGANYECWIKGQKKCNFAASSTNRSCSYESITITNDELFFAVDKPETRCNGEFQGCQNMGQATLDRAIDSFSQTGFVKSLNSVTKINNPDNYSATLCSSGVLYCEYLTGKETGRHAYYNPVDKGSGSGRVCVYDDKKKAWLEEGTNNLCNNRASQYLMTADNSLYRGWSGKCDDKYSGCEAFYNPEKPLTSQTGSASCDANINLSYQGVCNINNPGESRVIETGVFLANTGAQVTKYYCQKDILGVKHNVCELNSASDEECSYSSTDWYCLANENKNGNGQKVLTPCQVGDANNRATVCTIEPINDGQVHKRVCKYSPVCEANFFYQNSVKSCDGTLDREGGCLAFNQPSLGQANFATQATRSGESPKNCDSSSNYTSVNYCNANRLLKAEKDRTCSEWLYCASSINVGGQDVCLDMARCTQADASGNCILPRYTENRDKEVVYQATNPSQRDKTAWLTGYSKVGFDWGNNHSLAGYYAPEAMSQIGESVKIFNGDFENFEPLINSNNSKTELKIKDLATAESVGLNYQVNPECSYVFDPQNPYSGYYSLKVTTGSGNNWACTVSQKNSDSYFAFASKKSYALSFAARSNGSEGAFAGLSFYKDNNGVKENCAWGGEASGITASTPLGGLNPGSDVQQFVNGNYTFRINKKCNNNQTVNPSAPPAWLWGDLLKSISLSKEWQKIVVSFGPQGEFKDVPPSADYASFRIYAPHNVAGSMGSVWLDEIEIGPVLKQSNSTYSARDCRLYPKDDQGGYPACNYTSGNKIYNGWNGFCTQYDPQNPSQCLQWLPVDAIAGDQMSLYGDAQASVYSNQRPLYYCIQSRGLNNTSIPSTTYAEGFGFCPDTCSNESVADINFGQNYRTSDVGAIEVEFYDYWPNCDGGSGDWMPGRRNFEMRQTSLGEWVFMAHSHANITLMHMENTSDPHYLDYEYFRDHEMSGVGDENWVGIKLTKDNNGYIKQLRYKMCDGSANDGGIRFRLKVKPFEMCNVVAQVVDVNGQEMAQADTLRKWTNGNEYKLNYEFPISPYGAIKTPISGQVDVVQWPGVSINQGATLLDHINYSATLPLSVEKDTSSVAQGQRQCTAIWANDCSTVEDCKDPTTMQPIGECSGIGKFIYKDGYNTGKPCKDATNPDCHAIDVNMAKDVNSALGLLNKLYGRIYNVYSSAYSGTKWIYQNITSTLPLSNIEYFRTPGKYQIPKVENLSLNEQTNGNIAVDAPGSSIRLRFTTNISASQLPIDYLYVDWQDGSQPFVATGPLAARSDKAQPFVLSHIYSCQTNSDGTRCESCYGNGVFDSADGSCRYNWPKVQIMDHWKWCNCPQGSSCINNESTCPVDAFTSSTDPGSKIIIRSKN